MRSYPSEGIEALLLVEFEGEDLEKFHQRFFEIKRGVIQEEKLAFDLRVVRDDHEKAILEKTRGITGPILNKIKGSKRPLAFIEDAAVHPSLLQIHRRRKPNPWKTRFKSLLDSKKSLVFHFPKRYKPMRMTKMANIFLRRFGCVLKET